MAKKRLSKKLKEEIRQHPSKIKKSELGPEAAKYLIRIKAVRKAVKTKIAKEKYKKPRTKKQGEQEQVSDLIAAAAKSQGMSVKKYRKKYKKSVEEFEKDARLYHNREADLLINDIRFAERGRKVYVNGKRVGKPKAIYFISRLKNKILSTGRTYERINIEYNVDRNGNIHFRIPEPSELNLKKYEGDEDEMLNHIEDNYPISVYRK
jgi:hypothetical protein